MDMVMTCQYGGIGRIFGYGSLHPRQWLLAASFLATTVSVNGCGRSPVALEVPPERHCEIKLEWLGKAVADYRSEHGQLLQTQLGPGGFRHSWRVLVAPYMLAYTNHPHTFGYRFKEPWDSPHNREIFHKSWLAGSLTCPAEERSINYPFVSYVMLVRFDSTESDKGTRQAIPLPDNAVFIVESVGCGIKYGEPKDVDLEDLFEGDSPFGAGKLNSFHPRVVKALRVDGKVISIPKDITKADLRRLLEGTPDANASGSEQGQDER